MLGLGLCFFAVLIYIGTILFIYLLYLIDFSILFKGNTAANVERLSEYIIFDW